MIKKILLGLFILNSFNGICQKFNFSEATTAPLTKDPSKVTLKVLHLIQQNNLDSLMFLEETKEIYKNSSFINKIKFAQLEINKYFKASPKSEFILSFSIDSNRRVIYCCYKDKEETFINLNFYFECSCGKLVDFVVINKQELDIVAKLFIDYKAKYGSDSIPVPPPPPSYETFKASEECRNKAIGSTKDKLEIFNLVSVMPSYIGGDEALKEFIRNNIQFPNQAKSKNISGIVYVNFIVETDGTLSDINILKDIGGGCGEEALRIIKKMPLWNSGEQDGVKVRVNYNLPVEFKLH